jgi:hypothetical protein
MSEPIALGESDADARWIAIRRHQAVLVIVGLGLVGDWLVRASSQIVELVGGVTLLVCAAPAYDALTLAELLWVGACFLARSRWTLLGATNERGALSLRARGHVRVRGYALRHRGRLDLSGRDVQVALDLSDFADAQATSDRTSHVSVHVCSSVRGADTLLALREGTLAPPGWLENDELLLSMAEVTQSDASKWLLERWVYVRSLNGLVRVLRIKDFSAVPEGRALLERLQQTGNDVTVALHFDVIAGSRAPRLAGRAAHRAGSDSAASSLVGFRRTAKAERSLRRLNEREALVSNGKALLRMAVYVSVRATSQAQLRDSVAHVLRRTHEAGLRCERGVGRQALWFSFQLPGGPGW